jgi:hypothetical protein
MTFPKLLHEAIGSMEFPEDMLSDTLEQEDLGNTADTVTFRWIPLFNWL